MGVNKQTGEITMSTSFIQSIVSASCEFFHSWSFYGCYNYFCLIVSVNWIHVLDYFFFTALTSSYLQVFSIIDSLMCFEMWNGKRNILPSIQGIDELKRQFWWTRQHGTSSKLELDLDSNHFVEDIVSWSVLRGGTIRETKDLSIYLIKWNDNNSHMFSMGKIPCLKQMFKHV